MLFEDANGVRVINDTGKNNVVKGCFDELFKVKESVLKYI